MALSVRASNHSVVAPPSVQMTPGSFVGPRQRDPGLEAGVGRRRR
jgi:hypothetical protein